MKKAMWLATTATHLVYILEAVLVGLFALWADGKPLWWGVVFVLLVYGLALSVSPIDRFFRRLSRIGAKPP